jgi:hypothetical protein
MLSSGLVFGENGSRTHQCNIELSGESQFIALPDFASLLLLSNI